MPYPARSQQNRPGLPGNANIIDSTGGPRPRCQLDFHCPAGKKIQWSSGISGFPLYGELEIAHFTFIEDEADGYDASVALSPSAPASTLVGAENNTIYNVSVQLSMQRISKR